MAGFESTGDLVEHLFVHGFGAECSAAPRDERPLGPPAEWIPDPGSTGEPDELHVRR